MSFEYINRFYNLNAHKGMTILFKGEPVVIKGTQGCYLLVENKEKRELILHPTWEISWIEEWLP